MIRRSQRLQGGNRTHRPADVILAAHHGLRSGRRGEGKNITTRREDERVDFVVPPRFGIPISDRRLLRSFYRQPTHQARVSPRTSQVSRRVRSVAQRKVETINVPLDGFSGVLKGTAGARPRRRGVSRSCRSCCATGNRRAASRSSDEGAPSAGVAFRAIGIYSPRRAAVRACRHGPAAYTRKPDGQIPRKGLTKTDRCHSSSRQELPTRYG